MLRPGVFTMPLARLRASWVLFIAFTLALSGAAYGQVSVHGKVQNVGGQPLKSVTVTGAAVKTSTDEQGQFTVQLQSGAQPVQLLFEAPGFYPQKVTLKPSEFTVELEVTLTPRSVIKQDVSVIASRLDIPLAVNPAATTVVAPEAFDLMPKGVGAEEALQGVPGVKVDNQADGERVHVSIRGQGILSEHGLRGIQVVLDGIPLSDPTGFVADLYDIDWNNIQELAVMRGPVAVLYGGSSSGGVIDVTSRQPQETTHGGLWSSGGSNGLYKARADVSGFANGVGYSVDLARTAGVGYRHHTEFWGDNISGRLDFKPARNFHLNLLALGTGFFNQNAEGLNLEQVQEDRRMPNPDSVTYNEYQRTMRFLGGITGDWSATENQRLAFNFYTRKTEYKEPVPSSVEHRSMIAPGGSAQYHFDQGKGAIKNYFSAGVDLDRQSIDDWRHDNLGGAVEDATFLANESITQSRVATYAMDRIGFGSQWTAFLSARWDRMTNSLDDKLKFGGLDLSGDAVFTKASGRVGLSWTPSKQATVYASWGQGFQPPATEELLANPAALGGFNKLLIPATSDGEDLGVRGSMGSRFFYDLAYFHLNTSHDFERYRIDSRPLETFYGNAGKTSRNGFEAWLRWLPTNRVTLSGAYTYSHFTYTNYTSQTCPGNLVGNFLPNAPSQQLYVSAIFDLPHAIKLSTDVTAFSRAFIDPTNAAYIDGYGLWGARLSKGWQKGRTSGSFFVTGRNLTSTKYIAFTEPDPDGNSYQPGPEREIFGGMEVRF